MSTAIRSAADHARRTGANWPRGLVLTADDRIATHALGEYSSLGDGLFLIVTVMLINYGINALSYRVKWFERLVSAPPLPLVKDGKLLRRNLRREFVTEEEFNGHLRMNDIKDLSEVERAYVESEGHITFITRKKGR